MMVEGKEVEDHRFCGCNWCRNWAPLLLSNYDKMRLGYPVGIRRD
jgi:hypothetical protein